MTMVELIDQAKSSPRERERLANALLSAGPVHAGGVTFSGVRTPDGRWKVVQEAGATPGVPDAEDVEVLD